MRAVLVRTYGGPETPPVADLEAPAPRPGQVLVEVSAGRHCSGRPPDPCHRSTFNN